MEDSTMRHSIIGLMLTLALGILVAPLCSNAQQPGKVYRIGSLGTGLAPSEAQRQQSPFLQALRELGWHEGHNIAFEDRYAEGKLDRLPDLAAELVGLKVDLIVVGGANAIRAAQQATSTIPIVMTAIADAVRAGFIETLARPGGNITGVSGMASFLIAKRLELLKEAVPGVSCVAVLADPANPNTPWMVSEAELAARALGVRLYILILEVPDPSTLEPAFAALTTERAEAVMVLPAERFFVHRKRLVDLVAHHQLPAIYPGRWFIEAGGFMSYEANATEESRRAATYVDKILKGAKPADLPVEQPKKFEFIINLKAAKQISLTIPPNVLARADRVIR
jgi:putative tryptophan/tyrosine transport system substrate-binding protein